MLRWSFIGFYGAADEIGLPVPGVQIVERGRKIHEERKTRGDSPPIFPVYLNAWNRLR